MSLLDKLKKNSVVKEASSLEKSKFLEPDFTISTMVLAINIAMSGELYGGMKSGLLQIAGPSRHFKTNMGLIIASAFLRSDKDAVILFYDSEFGASKKYFESAGIDPARVLHVPIVNIEELKFDLVKQLEGIERKDKVLIFIDSIGNLASKKEAEDALDGKSVADMTRAKALKSLWRIVTPYLTTKQVPCIAINHTYKTMELYAKDVVGGGCVVENTMVKMADGSLKAIQEIKVGDCVITHIGAKEVTATWNPETLCIGEPETYNVTFEDGSVITCSDQHRFLTENGWKYVTDLAEGDELVKI